MKYFTLLETTLKQIERGYESPLKKNGLMTNVKPVVKFEIEDHDDPDVLVSLSHELEGMKDGYLGGVSSLLTGGEGEITKSENWWPGSIYKITQLEESHKVLSQSGIPYSIVGSVKVPVDYSKSNVKPTNHIDFCVSVNGNTSVFDMKASYESIFGNQKVTRETKKRFGRVSFQNVILEPNHYAIEEVTALSDLLGQNVEDVFKHGVTIDSKVLMEFLKKEKVEIDNFDSRLIGKVPDLPQGLVVEYKGKSDDVKASFKKEGMNFKLEAQADAFDVPQLTKFCDKLENVFINHCEDKR
jgi:hypothetical protein